LLKAGNYIKDFIENSVRKSFIFLKLHEQTTKDQTLKPCPRCLLAHWQTGGQTKIRHIPQFMESCRDCCDPGEYDLRDKEAEQFRELVHKARNARTRKRPTCDNIIVVKNSVL
jgi:hypothetical protein